MSPPGAGVYPWVGGVVAADQRQIPLCGVIPSRSWQTDKAAGNSINQAALQKAAGNEQARMRSVFLIKKQREKHSFVISSHLAKECPEMRVAFFVFLRRKIIRHIFSDGAEVSR